MVFWKDVKEISLPMRFQIPRGYCEYGTGQYGQINLCINNPEFMEWFKKLENILIKDGGDPIDSRVKENYLSVKYVDGFTQVFDSSNVLMIDGHNFEDCELDCLVDIDRVYSLNGYQGITCKLFQVRVLPVELHFSS